MNNVIWGIDPGKGGGHRSLCYWYDYRIPQVS